MSPQYVKSRFVTLHATPRPNGVKMAQKDLIISNVKAGRGATKGPRNAYKPSRFSYPAFTPGPGGRRIPSLNISEIGYSTGLRGVLFHYKGYSTMGQTAVVARFEVALALGERLELVFSFPRFAGTKENKLEYRDG